jgi:hypothetical protein
LKEDAENPGLLNILSEEERQLLLIIFMISPEGKRLYTTFDDYADYIKFYFKELVQPERRCCDEVILEDKRQKIRFDIDAKKDKLENPQLLIDQLITHLLIVFSSFGIELNLSSDVIICSSHSETKWSYHIIIDNYCCVSSHEVKEWFRLVYDRLDPCFQPFLDTQIYSPNHGFRLLGSTKLGEVRLKKLEEEWLYNNQWIKYRYPEEIVSPKHKFLLQFDATTVTLTLKCCTLPVLLPEEDPLSKKFVSQVDIDEPVVKKAMDLCNEFNGSAFTYKKTLGSLVLLERSKEAHCIICHTVHEHIEPYLVVKQVGEQYQVYFDCRRSNGKREWLGTIQNEKVEISKKIDVLKMLKLAKIENKKLYS